LYETRFKIKDLNMIKIDQWAVIIEIKEKDNE